MLRKFTFQVFSKHSCLNLRNFWSTECFIDAKSVWRQSYKYFNRDREKGKGVSYTLYILHDLFFLSNIHTTTKKKYAIKTE